MKSLLKRLYLTPTQFTLLVLGIVMFWYWMATAEEREKKAAAERHQAEADGLGFSASIAAGTMLSAWRSCKAVGISSVPECVTHKGPLLQDQTAPVIAKVAMDSYNDWNAACLRHYDGPYCNDFFNRALAVSDASRKLQKDD